MCKGHRGPLQEPQTLAVFWLAVRTVTFCRRLAQNLLAVRLESSASGTANLSPDSLDMSAGLCCFGWSDFFVSRYLGCFLAGR